MGQELQVNYRWHPAICLLVIAAALTACWAAVAVVAKFLDIY